MRGFAHAYRLSRSGVVLVELMVSSVVALAVIAGLLSAAAAIRRSIAATNQYAVGVANESRLMDYVAQDLRRAVGVGMLTGTTYTPLKNDGPYIITETNVLAINIPDYYGSNTPDNAASSAYKKSRYTRATLNTSTFNSNAVAKLNGVVPWTDAVTVVGGKQVTRFAPTVSGTGELQVRYYRGVRSVNDPTVCFFRSEYQSLLRLRCCHNRVPAQPSAKARR